MSVNPLLIILGATASGKTHLAVNLAHDLNGEIISADSRQVFKHMDIGTGKDLNEYHIKGKIIPHHLIDILEPGERYHVNAFKEDFYNAFQTITHKNRLPILCGGTGMYIHSLLQNQEFTAVPVNEGLRTALELQSREALNERLNLYSNQEHVDINSKKRLIRAIEIAEYLKHNTLDTVDRPTFKPIVFGLKNTVEITRAKILKRLNERLNAGMIEEVKDLLSYGISQEMLVFYGLEYKFIAQYLAGAFSFDDLKLKLGIAICQFAKRQSTFFRKMEKDGVKINWLNAAQNDDVLKTEVANKLSIEGIN
ncbi:tRNA (adenosine(37)-N6)-dimethylallyltransferase MiaA [Pedobacter punctiformis]|uniref:tRNA dimethylallyltransferase n=1 Tax=Pedobacter punctiformis TaxID=3004097 RepID=A0ABT4L6T5_9SPHI|nr:tRNA (adenosine(37)-N6)-dimethylallyltransferase MiaA [Pedobacter sp. HCMS5-2]MCZ4243636.1 tRNA (adenosine(37)-N6)-dimethylallyltransferase MiaA [Pedobacter sp. HCMS5-2]